MDDSPRVSHTLFFFLFKNQYVYHVEVGDIVPIYYTNNSCCRNCAPNKNDLKHLKFQEEKVVLPIMVHCEGCDQMYGMFFRAESVGVDTIFRIQTTHFEECNQELKVFDQFIVYIH